MISVLGALGRGRSRDPPHAADVESSRDGSVPARTRSAKQEHQTEQAQETISKADFDKLLDMVRILSDSVQEVKAKQQHLENLGQAADGVGAQFRLQQSLHGAHGSTALNTSIGQQGFNGLQAMPNSSVVGVQQHMLQQNSNFSGNAQGAAPHKPPSPTYYDLDDEKPSSHLAVKLALMGKIHSIKPFDGTDPGSWCRALDMFFLGENVPPADQLRIGKYLLLPEAAGEWSLRLDKYPHTWEGLKAFVCQWYGTNTLAKAKERLLQVQWKGCPDQLKKRHSRSS